MTYFHLVNDSGVSYFCHTLTNMSCYTVVKGNLLMLADNFLCISQIRRQAIKGLPDLCKDTPEHLPRIADVLTQLLQSGTYMYTLNCKV